MSNPFKDVAEYSGEKTPYVKEIQKRRQLSLDRLTGNPGKEVYGKTQIILGNPVAKSQRGRYIQMIRCMKPGDVTYSDLTTNEISAYRIKNIKMEVVYTLEIYGKADPIVKKITRITAIENLEQFFKDIKDA